jgi:hypothetical protein
MYSTIMVLPLLKTERGPFIGRTSFPRARARCNPWGPLHTDLDRVPARGVTGGWSPCSPAGAGLVSWREPEG